MYTCIIDDASLTWYNIKDKKKKSTKEDAL